jgi:hypothetical protein
LLPPEETRFFNGLDAFVSSPNQQQMLSLGAARTAERLTMDAMASRFDALMHRLLHLADAPSPGSSIDS